MITLRKSDIQDMIDEAADSLHDDVEESIQALQIYVLKQAQRQSDECSQFITMSKKKDWNP